MSHTKHHMKMKSGGAIREAKAPKDRDDYSGSGEPDVVKDAEKKKGGGAVRGHKGKHRVKKARGGSCDASPFSSAHRG